MKTGSRLHRRNRVSHPLRCRRLLCEPLEERSLLAVVVSITATDGEAAEPSDNGTFQITRTDDLEAALDVEFSIGGSASRGTDYLLKVGGTEVSGSTITIPAGQASVDVALEAVDNATAEFTETAVMTLEEGTGYTIGTSDSATINIADNDPPVLTVIAADSSAGEPSNHGTYQIRRAGSTEAALSVEFVIGGTAERGEEDDYVLKVDGTEVTGTTLNLAAGEDSLNVTLEVVDDSLQEPPETAVLTLQAATGYTVGSLDTATVNIADNDLVTISATDPDAAEPSNGGVYRIARTGSTESPLTVTFAVGGTAEQGTENDYVLKVGDTELTDTTVIIPAGETFIDVTLEVADDDVAESQETAILSLQAGQYTVGTAGSATVTIADDDPPVVTIAAVDPNAAEPADDGTYRITRVGSTQGSLTVNFGVGGTATRGTGDDYFLRVGGTVLTGTSVAIPAGQASVDVVLEVIDDVAVEDSETAVLTLQSGTGYTVGDEDSATVQIEDDNDNDAAVVTITATDATAAEPSNNGTYRISRTGSTEAALTVTFTAGGTATLGTGDDYVLKVGTTDVTGTTVTIPAGQSFVDVTLEVLDDFAIEASETAVLALQLAMGYTVGTQQSRHGEYRRRRYTGRHDWPRPMPPRRNRRTMTFRIMRTGSTTSALNVTFAASGTATLARKRLRAQGRNGGRDGTTVTIPAGQSFVDVTLDVLDDTAAETSETAVLTLQSGTGYTVGTQQSATVNIADDEAAVVTVTATDAAAAEPSNDGTFRITRTGSTTSALNVTFAVSGTATRGTGSDYVLKVGTTDVTGTTVTIPAGQSSVDVTLDVLNDSAIEASETAVLTLQSGTGYTVGTQQSATVNIADDDGNGSLSGYVWLDTDNDGVRDLDADGLPTEMGLPGVTVKLQKKNSQDGTYEDVAGVAPVTTGPDGVFLFDNLPAGTYQVLETQPNDFADGKETVGTAGGTAENNKITDIELAAGEHGEDYLFAETNIEPESISIRLFLNSTPSSRTIIRDHLGVKEVFIEGTSGADTIVFTAGTNSHTVTVNGKATTYTASEVDVFTIDAGGGEDSVTLNGAAGVDQAESMRAWGSLKGSNYMVEALNAETLKIDGKGGTNDTAVIFDSAGSDDLAAGDNKATIDYGDYLAELIAFERVRAVSELGGNDTAEQDAIDFVLMLEGGWDQP